jgi:hypothetical protein
MDEKEKNSLTVNDILDQLTKPSILKEPQAAPRPQASLPSVQKPPSPSPLSGSVQLPQLGAQKATQEQAVKKDDSPQEFKLAIRTMASDVRKLQQGEKPSSFEFSRAANGGEVIPKPAEPVRPPKPVLPPIPNINVPVPPQAKMSPPLSSAADPGHYHPEKVISDSGVDIGLPEFLGAPVPKKKKPATPEEKVEYGLIARVIGSGMTTGIISTIILAIGLWFALSYFVFNVEEEPIVTPTPTADPFPTLTPSTANELETIFKNVKAVDYLMPENKEGLATDLGAFINRQEINKKEIKRFNFTGAEGQKLLVTDILEKLSINPPLELRGYLGNNYIVLIYGQEEILSDKTNGQAPKRIAFIVEVKDPLKASELMSSWEASLPANFDELFDLDRTKQASQNFLDNSYRNIKIRYKNFPLPDKSLDYAIIKSLSGKNYLMVTNSRESIYVPYDIISGVK